MHFDFRVLVIFVKFCVKTIYFKATSLYHNKIMNLYIYAIVVISQDFFQHFQLGKNQCYKVS